MPSIRMLDVMSFFLTFRLSADESLNNEISKAANHTFYRPRPSSNRLLKRALNYNVNYELENFN